MYFYQRKNESLEIKKISGELISKKNNLNIFFVFLIQLNNLKIIGVDP